MPENKGARGMRMDGSRSEGGEYELRLFGVVPNSSFMFFFQHFGLFLGKLILLATHTLKYFLPIHVVILWVPVKP